MSPTSDGDNRECQGFDDTGARVLIGDGVIERRSRVIRGKGYETSSLSVTRMANPPMPEHPPGAGMGG